MGIDWSGRRGWYHKGIQIAESLKNDPHPNLRYPNDGSKSWSRSAVVKYIRSLKDSPTLVEIDFAFSLPKPFPVAGLKNPRQLWDLIDDLCWAATDDDVREYYAGPVWLSEESPFPPYVRYADYRGPQFDGKLLRHTERASKPRTTSVYKLMYSQVGRGSFAGKRMLRSLYVGNEIAIWLFDEIDFSKSVVVEVYPSRFYAMADRKRPNPEKQTREAVDSVVNEVLRYLNVTCGYEKPGSQDEIDAFITAAAIACLTRQLSVFSVPSHLQAVVAKDGWILGVHFGGAA